MNPIIIFVLTLTPNWLRQVSYYLAKKKTGQTSFCESFETLWMMRTKNYYLGWLEEVGFAALWTVLHTMGYSWFALGWVFDAVQDTAIAALTPKKSPFHGLGAFWKRELVREVLLPYIIVGPLLWWLGVSVAWFSTLSVLVSVVLVFKQLKKN